jgi:hypothetical protein
VRVSPGTLTETGVRMKRDPRGGAWKRNASANQMGTIRGSGWILLTVIAFLSSRIIAREAFPAGMTCVLGAAGL